MHGPSGRQRHRDRMVFEKFQFDELLFNPKFSSVGNGKVDSNFLLLERFDWIGFDLFACTNGKRTGAHHIKATRTEIPRIQRSSMDESSDCKLRDIRADLFLLQLFRFKHTNTKRSHLDWSALSCCRNSLLHSCHDRLVYQGKTRHVNATKKEQAHINLGVHYRDVMHSHPAYHHICDVHCLFSFAGRCSNFLNTARRYCMFPR
mmetsp:Transcript_25072/g.47601  ORF Transcript_25072/g.47601 Transcript_25072/m.47601 type:complete len:204 (+) Transcript_25072:1670-2281(+)